MTFNKMTVDKAYFWETAPMPGYIAFQIAFIQNKSIASRNDQEVSLLI